MAVNKKAASYAGIVTLVVFGGIAAIVFGFIFDASATFIVLGIIVGTIVVCSAALIVFQLTYEAIVEDLAKRKANQ